jgi:hypothetical protein
MSNAGAGAISYQLAFEVSPIILTNGIATFMGGMLPIIALTQSVDFLTGLLNGNANPDLDSYFAQFMPLPGATLIDNKIGMYPFANQAIAANAIISQPLVVSLQMIVPARSNGSGVWSKLATMTALQFSLSQHNSLGGTYIVATPSYFYTNCIMTGMRDVSGGETKQAQYRWQLDFVQPLITLAQANQVQSQAMSLISNGAPTTGALSGISTTPNSLTALSLQPGVAQVAAGGTAPLIPVQVGSPLSPPVGFGPSPYPA